MHIDFPAIVDYLKHSLLVKGAVTGAVAAARVDVKTFNEAKARGEVADFITHFNFAVARRRWISGALWGAATGGAFDGLGF